MDYETKSKIILGTFDSENFWRSEVNAKLPAIPDKEMINIISAMDEIMFPFCKKNDVLLTRFKMDKSHKQYLNQIGFEFYCNEKDIDESYQSGKIKRDICIFQILSEIQKKEYIKALVQKNAIISPFAVVPHTKTFCDIYDIEMCAPDIDIIKKVNSKIYSTHINESIFGKSHSIIVENSEQLLEEGKKILKTNHLLIKDEFGVSGKGNLLIDSENILKRIVMYLMEQEKRGKKISFVLEPLLEREMDFSCQFHVGEDGKYSLISVQKILNSGFAYSGSFTAEEDFLSMLENTGYFKTMEKVAEKLYESKYFGHVCIDSMLLKSGDIIPIVEINARKSMSLIKHNIDKFLQSFSIHGSLTYLNVSFSSDICLEDILNKMQMEGILFEPGKLYGVLPLSSNTLFINREINSFSGNDKKPVKGRWYISLIADNNEEREILLNRTKEILAELSFNIF